MAGSHDKRSRKGGGREWGGSRRAGFLLHSWTQLPLIKDGSTWASAQAPRKSQGGENWRRGYKAKESQSPQTGCHKSKETSKISEQVFIYHILSILRYIDFSSSSHFNILKEDCMLALMVFYHCHCLGVNVVVILGGIDWTTVGLECSNQQKKDNLRKEEIWVPGIV